jgi:HlyD family secretion protein
MTDTQNTTEHTSEKTAGASKGLLIGGLVVAALGALVAAGLWKAAEPVRVPLQGMVDARTISAAAKIPGRIGEILVREGDRVEKGAVLARIEIPELEAKLGQVKAQQDAAQAQSRLVDEGARSEQIAAAKAQYERAAAGSALAAKTYERVHSLFKEGLISAQKDDEARANMLSARNLRNAARSQYDMARTGARKDEKAAASSMAEKAAQGVAEVSSLAREAELRAPVAGEITRVMPHAGEVVPAGFPIASILDHSDKWVVFNVREDDLPGIEVGTEFTAQVPALAKSVKLRVYFINPRGEYATWRSTRQSSGYDIRTFEVRARPVGESTKLRPGMSAIVER